MIETLENLQTLEAFIGGHALAAVYFSTPQCSVCHVLKPRLLQLFERRFPAIAVAEVDCVGSPKVAAQQQVFAVPTLIVYIEGRENIRRSRNFSPAEVEQVLARPYALFNDD